MTNNNGDPGVVDNDLPSAVKATRPMSSSAAFKFMSRFLKSEKAKQDPGAIQHSHWDDLFHVTETLADNSSAQANVLRSLRLSAVKPRSHSALFSDIETRENPLSIEHESVMPVTLDYEKTATSESKRDEKKRKRAAKKEKEKKIKNEQNS